MTSAESIAVAEKLMALLKSAASLGMTATLNLETRNRRICTTFTCEEFMNSDGKPSSDAGEKKHKSKGCIKRSKERLIKYQNNKKKDMEKENNWRKNKSVEKDNVKTSEKPFDVAEGKGPFSESVLVCDKCSYKCARTETMEKHMGTKHKINKIICCEYCTTHRTSKNKMKDRMEIHKLEQNEQQSSQGNSNKSIEEQIAAFEEEKRKDIQSHKDIEQLLKECEEDMRNDTEDDEVYSESESKD